MLPIVCLPGLLSTPSVYARTVAHPALAAATVLPLPDQDVFGAIGARIAESLPARCLLVGHSMGAYLCLDIWRRAPERIAAMVLISCTAQADTEQTARGRAKAVAWSAKAGMNALAGVIADQMLAPARRGNAALRSEVARMARAIGQDTFARHQTALAARPDSSEALPGITCPVLALTGSEDPVTPPDAGRAIAAQVQDGRFHAIAGAGHLLPLEAPEELAGHIAAFLADSVPTRPPRP